MIRFSINLSLVILVKVIGGGHTWPGGRQYLNPRMVGVVSRDMNASDMILDFFTSFTIG
jgi:polyhydroxybutyrate depolymerase